MSRPVLTSALAGFALLALACSSGGEGQEGNGFFPDWGPGEGSGGWDTGTRDTSGGGGGDDTGSGGDDTGSGGDDTGKDTGPIDTGDPGPTPGSKDNPKKMIGSFRAHPDLGKSSSLPLPWRKRIQKRMGRCQ